MATANAADRIFIPSEGSARGRNDRIYVIFTNVIGTKAALAAAVRLAHGLDLPVSLVAARSVPYPLPLESPPVSLEFTEEGMSNLVRDVDTSVAVQVLLCREPEEVLHYALGPEALVVMGKGKGWWKSRYRKLARRLTVEGRRLVLID